jgi:hypothetical protein
LANLRRLLHRQKAISNQNFGMNIFTDLLSC